MGNKKKFDKKSSVTFKLVHRSQRDPLTADERAPQHVLLPVNDDNARQSSDDKQTRKDEQKKFGIYFDDDYNYLQHLRDVKSVNEWQPIVANEPKSKSNQNTLLLPSSMFASNIEEEEGLLSKGVLPVGPQPDWDPEIVAAMDEDFNYEDPNNQIDDDFVLQAEDIDDNDGNDDDDDEWQDISDEENENEELDDDSDESTVCDDHSSNFNYGNDFEEEETKSHFTNYSLTSSVMRRNDGLTTLDQRFETLYEKEYSNDCDIGALDFDDIEGYVDPNKSELMRKLIEEFEVTKSGKVMYENECSRDGFVFDESKYNSERLVEIEVNENGKNGDKEDRFDCESILSSYSNLYNHPKMIRDEPIKQRVKINPKTGIPFGVIDKKGLTARNLAKLDEFNTATNDDMCTKSVRSSISRLSELSMRSTNETPQERRLRKLALREYRRERRAEKKSNRLAFKSEQSRQNKEIISLQQNFKSVKIV